MVTFRVDSILLNLALSHCIYMCQEPVLLTYTREESGQVIHNSTAPMDEPTHPVEVSPHSRSSWCSYMWCYWPSTRRHKAHGNTIITQTKSNQLPHSGEGAKVSAVNRFSRPQGQALDSLFTTHMAHMGSLRPQHIMEVYKQLMRFQPCYPREGNQTQAAKK